MENHDKLCQLELNDMKYQGVLRKISVLIDLFWKLPAFLKVNEKYSVYTLSQNVHIGLHFKYIKFKCTLWYTFQAYKINVHHQSIFQTYSNIYWHYWSKFQA